MTTGEFWLLIALCTVVTALIKGIGPFALGGRELPPRFTHVVALLPAALLAALVVVGTLAEGEEWTAGADTIGVAVAGVAFWRGASVIAGVIIAAATTAALRAAGVG